MATPPSIARGNTRPVRLRSGEALPTDGAKRNNLTLYELPGITGEPVFSPLFQLTSAGSRLQKRVRGTRGSGPGNVTSSSGIATCTAYCSEGLLSSAPRVSITVRAPRIMVASSGSSTKFAANSGGSHRLVRWDSCHLSRLSVTAMRKTSTTHVPPHLSYSYRPRASGETTPRRPASSKASFAADSAALRPSSTSPFGRTHRVRRLFVMSNTSR